MNEFDSVIAAGKVYRLHNVVSHIEDAVERAGLNHDVLADVLYDTLHCYGLACEPCANRY